MEVTVDSLESSLSNSLQTAVAPAIDSLLAFTSSTFEQVDHIPDFGNTLRLLYKEDTDMVKRYVAEIKPVNEDVIGTAVSGKAELVEENDTLKIKIEATGTPPNMMHWSHFHGFTDNRKGRVPTKDADTNGDGVIDLPELYAVSGQTMVPFDDAPHNMHIPHDNYPHADENGNWNYEFEVPLTELKEKFKEKFGSEDLELDKRTVLIHGVPESLELPDTVEGTVKDYGPHTTLPIGAGEIEAIN